MQKSSHDLSIADRRLVRKWRIAVVGFYGSLLLIIGVLSLLPDKDVRTARAVLPSGLQGK